jgi:hypothetical protein
MIQKKVGHDMGQFHKWSRLRENYLSLLPLGPGSHGMRNEIEANKQKGTVPLHKEASDT